MIQILDEIVTDQNLAWNNELQNKIENFYVELSDNAINELLENKMNLDENSKNLVILQNEIKEFKKILVRGCGFFIIKHSCFSNFSVFIPDGSFCSINKLLEFIFSALEIILGSYLSVIMLRM